MLLTNLHFYETKQEILLLIQQIHLCTDTLQW